MIMLMLLRKPDARGKCKCGREKEEVKQEQKIEIVRCKPKGNTLKGKAGADLNSDRRNTCKKGPVLFCF